MITFWILAFSVAFVMGFALVLATGVIARAELPIVYAVCITLSIEAVHFVCATLLLRWTLTLFFIAWVPMLAGLLRAVVPVSIGRAMLIALVVVVLWILLLMGVVALFLGDTFTF